MVIRATALNPTFWRLFYRHPNSLAKLEFPTGCPSAFAGRRFRCAPGRGRLQQLKIAWLNPEVIRDAVEGFKNFPPSTRNGAAERQDAAGTAFRRPHDTVGGRD